MTAGLVASLLANDTDPDSGDIIRITSVTQGGKGSVAFNNGGTPGNPADDTLTYTANGNVLDTLGVGETATDTFTYTVSDGHGSTDTATVTVTINGVNDAPVIDLNGSIARTRSNAELFHWRGSYGNRSFRNGCGRRLLQLRRLQGRGRNSRSRIHGKWFGNRSIDDHPEPGRWRRIDRRQRQQRDIWRDDLSAHSAGGTNGSNLVVTIQRFVHLPPHRPCLSTFSTQMPPARRSLRRRHTRWSTVTAPSTVVPTSGRRQQRST